MIDAIAGEVRRDITPHMQDFHIRFREGRDHMPKPIAARFKQAVEISEDRPAEACAAWQAIDAEMPDHPRSEERPGGEGCVSTCRSRCAPDNYKKSETWSL